MTPAFSRSPEEREAKVRWRQVLSLDPSDALRRKLRAAGVGERRIEALYPFDFEALAPGITAEFRRRGFSNASLKLEAWSALASKASTIAEFQADGGRWEAEGSVSDGENFLNLWEELDRSVRKIPVGSAGTAARIANLMVDQLWNACWFMANLDGNSQPKAACEFFIDITDRLLPGLTRLPEID